MAQFYIVQKSNWQGDTWKPIAGPFDNKGTAEAQKKSYEYHPHSGTGGINSQSQRHAKTVSRTWLSKNGYPNSPEGRAQLAESVSHYKEEWRNFMQP